VPQAGRAYAAKRNSASPDPILIFGDVGCIGGTPVRRLPGQGQSVVVTARSAERADALASETLAKGGERPEIKGG
jgi:uncharacterized protein YbjT (DUF2867 family)